MIDYLTHNTYFLLMSSVKDGLAVPSSVNSSVVCAWPTPPIRSTPLGESQLEWSILPFLRVWVFFHLPPENVTHDFRSAELPRAPQVRSPFCVCLSLPAGSLGKEQSLVPLLDINSTEAWGFPPLTSRPPDTITTEIKVYVMQSAWWAFPLPKSFIKYTI